MTSRLPDELNIDFAHPVADVSASGSTATQALHPEKRKGPDLSSGIAIGRICRIDGTARAWVDFAPLAVPSAWAHSLCRLDSANVGQACAVQFVVGDPAQPVILGMLLADEGPVSAPENLPDDLAAEGIFDARIDGRRLIIEAAHEIELRCGEARILMTEDGQIQIRGTYVTSHASATQRIRGGSVQLN